MIEILTVNAGLFLLALTAGGVAAWFGWRLAAPEPNPPRERRLDRPDDLARSA